MFLVASDRRQNIFCARCEDQLLTQPYQTFLIGELEEAAGTVKNQASPDDLCVDESDGVLFIHHFPDCCGTKMFGLLTVMAKNVVHHRR
jgi:hypothetical protein